MVMRIKGQAEDETKRLEGIKKSRKGCRQEPPHAWRVKRIRDNEGTVIGLLKKTVQTKNGEEKGEATRHEAVKPDESTLHFILVSGEPRFGVSGGARDGGLAVVSGGEVGFVLFGTGRGLALGEWGGAVELVELGEEFAPSSEPGGALLGGHGLFDVAAVVGGTRDPVLGIGGALLFEVGEPSASGALVVFSHGAVDDMGVG